MIDEILDTVIHGDALAVLKTIEDNSISAIICDPPCGISFMSRNWDDDKGGRTQWVSWLSEIMSQCLRVLLPGGHALIWSLPRQSHWTALALEDAGFTIRDCLYNLVSGDTILLNFLDSLNEEQQHAFIQLLDAQREPSGILQIFGQGFPKSANIGKMIDKMQGVEREILGWEHPADKYDNSHRKENPRFRGVLNGGKIGGNVLAPITKPATPESEAWNGWGSNLKPSVENWWLVRKPLAASSIAENVLQYGTGAINVDATRVGYASNGDKQHSARLGHGGHTSTASIFNTTPHMHGEQHNNGRFPSHLLLTHTPSCIQVGTKRVHVNDKAHTRHSNIGKMGYGSNTSSFECEGYAEEDGMETVTAWECPEWCPVRVLDEQVAGTRTNKPSSSGMGGLNDQYVGGQRGKPFRSSRYTDSGGASRYFQQLPSLDDIPPYIYAGKASRRDRNEGLEGLPEEQGVKQFNVGMEGKTRSDGTIIKDAVKQQNTHPTVKSQALLSYLCTLITPPGGIILDCFGGSGSTGVAAINNGFHFILVEKELEYVNIARARIQHAISTSGTNHPTPDMPLATPVPANYNTTHKSRNAVHSSQMTLWNTVAEKEAI